MKSVPTAPDSSAPRTTREEYGRTHPSQGQECSRGTIIRKRIGIVFITLSVLSTSFLVVIPVIIGQIQHCNAFTTMRGCSGYASIGFLGIFVLILVGIPLFASGLALLISAIHEQKKQLQTP